MIKPIAPFLPLPRAMRQPAKHLPGLQLLSNVTPTALPAGSLSTRCPSPLHSLHTPCHGMPPLHCVLTCIAGRFLVNPLSLTRA